MAKQERFIAAIRKEFGCSYMEARRILAGTNKAIRETLLSGDRVLLLHLGVLIPSLRKSRLSRNVFSGRIEKLPEKKTVVLKLTPDFLRDLNSGT